MNKILEWLIYKEQCMRSKILMDMPPGFDDGISLYGRFAETIEKAFLGLFYPNKITYSTYGPHKQWLEQNSNSGWVVRRFYGQPETIYFRKNSDAVAFKIRWAENEHN